MAFKYTKVQDTDYVREISHTLNSVGDYLQTMSNERDTLPTYSRLVVTDSASLLQTNVVYYLTNIQGFPTQFGASYNGYGMLLKRNPSVNYHTFVFLPYNSSVVYYRVYNGAWQDWQSTLTTENTTNYQKYAFTDEKGQVSNNKSIDIKNTTGYSKSKGTLVDAPTEDSKGWIDYSDTQGGEASQTLFNPTESTSLFTKQKKQAIVKQNPNIIQDSLFTNHVPYTYIFQNDTNYWGTSKGVGRVIRTDKKFKGQNIVELNDTKGSYSTFRGKALTVGEGKDLQVGKTYTLSAYVMTPDVSKLKENYPYIEVSYPSSLDAQSNPTIDSQLNITGLENNQWKRVSVTFTVPSNVVYARPNLRFNIVKSGTNNGGLVYYALPKLEEGSEATPFITNSNDSKQFDELWSNWNEYISKEKLAETATTDILGKVGYFKYPLTKEFLDNLGMDFYTYVGDLPQGFHTFYMQNGAPGNVFNDSVRGTIMLDYSQGDEMSTNKRYAIVECVNNKGVHYSAFFDWGNEPRQIVRQSEMQTLLWEDSSSFDLATGGTITLNDDYTNYKALDFVVYFRLSATYRTIRVYPVASSIVVRDLNLANNNTNANLDTYEGNMSLVDSKTIKADSAKQLTLNIGSGTENIVWNQTNTINIYKIIGVHTV
ncbi:virion component tail fiber [Staphylococcus phage vB_SsapH-Golestan-100]|nr:virion component tail fiber [Staphylococcus phage vB_SsapH-Golestan-100]